MTGPPDEAGGGACSVSWSVHKLAQLLLLAVPPEVPQHAAVSIYVVTFEGF